MDLSHDAIKHGNTSSRCDEMYALIKSGLKFSEVASRFGVSVPAVHRACKRRGYSGGRKPGPERQRRGDEMAALIKSGKTFRAVADQFGCSPVAVLHACEIRGYITGWRDWVD